MTENQIEIATAFGKLKTGQSPWCKRFAADMYHHAVNMPGKALTDAQNLWLYKLLYKYRKQLKSIYLKNKPDADIAHRVNTLDFLTK